MLTGSPSPAQADTSGEITTLLWQGENSLQQQRQSLLQRLRLRWQHDSAMFDWQVEYDIQALYGGVVRDPLFSWQKAQPPTTWLDAEATMYDHTPWWLTHRLYRGWLRWHHHDAQLTVGRQRIAWGTGRVWNPTDIFNPVQPTALEPEEKTGVDALSGQWNYSGFGSIQAVLAPGKTAWGIPRKLALRWRDTFPVGDVSLSAMRIDRQTLTGADYAGNMGDAGIRLEAMRSMDGRRQQWLVGTDINIVNNWFSEGLYLAAEYFNNSAADPAWNPLLPSSPLLQSRSRQLLALRASYDLTPLWHAELSWLQDLEASSQAALPTLQWSASDNLEVQCSLQWLSGQRGEYAGLNTQSMIRVRWFF